MISPVLILTHEESFVVFSLPCPAEEESDREALMAPGIQPGSTHHNKQPKQRSNLTHSACCRRHVMPTQITHSKHTPLIKIKPEKSQGVLP